MEDDYAGYPSKLSVFSLQSSVFGLIVCNNSSKIEIAQRAKKIMARFFVALLFFLLVVPCQADNQSSVMQKVISQQSIPSSNLFLVSKGFESVVRDMDAYFTMALKGQISVSGVLPPKDVRGVVQQQKGLLSEIDADIVEALLNEAKDLSQQGVSSALLKQHEVFVQRYRQNMDGLLKALDQIIKADDGQLIPEIEAALTFINRLIPQKELQEPYPSLPKPPANVPYIHLPMESVTIDEIQDSLEEMLEKNKKQLAPSLQAAPTDMSALLNETPDIQITLQIRALAKELMYSPVKIFEWVYNNIDYTPYYGSFKGSGHTLLEKSGNDWDTCSLLMALFRASNIPCRYVRGLIRMDIETAMNWIGVKDAQAACDVFYSSGYPITRLLSSDKQTLLGFSKLEHVIVEACLPYGNYRGAANDSTEKIWIPLDPSFKEYKYTEGNLDARNVDFATSTYYAKVQELSPIEYHKTQITGNQEEMRMRRQIKQKVFDFLPEVLPYYGNNRDKDTEGVYYPYCIWRGSLDTLTSLEERHRFRILAGAGYSEVEASLSFPCAYGKRLSLSYEPAAEEDKKAINDGHFHLAKFKAVFRLDGEKIAVGKREITVNDIGGTELAGIYPIHPVPRERDAEGNGAMGTVTKFTPVIVGGCSAFVVDTSGDMEKLIQERLKRLSDNIAEEDKGSGLVDDEIIGEVLHITGLRYFNECEKQARDISSLNHYYYQPSINNAILSQQISSNMLAGNVIGIELTNEVIDVNGGAYDDFLYSVEGTGDRKGRNLATLIGANNSYFEHKVLEDTFDVPAVSAVKIIQLANEQGIPVRYITADNISVLDGMNIPNSAKKNIRDSIKEHPEKVVIIPEKEIEYYDWVGIGYIVEDTETGDGSYMIGGGLRGGATAKKQSKTLQWIKIFSEEVINGLGPNPIPVICTDPTTMKSTINMLNRNTQLYLLYRDELGYSDKENHCFKQPRWKDGQLRSYQDIE